MDDSQHRPSDSFTVNAFADRLHELRQRYQTKLSGEHTNPPSLEDTVEALSQMVLAIEAVQSILGRAAGGSGDHLPGIGVSVQSLVDQVLTGEARDTSRERLTDWIRAAILQLRENHLGVEEQLSRMRKGVVKTFNPRSIELATPVPLWRRLLGQRDGAYWHEYSNRFKHLDGLGVSRLLEQNSDSSFD